MTIFILCAICASVFSADDSLSCYYSRNAKRVPSPIHWSLKTQDITSESFDDYTNFFVYDNQNDDSISIHVPHIKTWDHNIKHHELSVDYKNIDLNIPSTNIMHVGFTQNTRDSFHMDITPHITTPSQITYTHLEEVTETYYHARVWPNDLIGITLLLPAVPHSYTQSHTVFGRFFCCIQKRNPQHTQLAFSCEYLSTPAKTRDIDGMSFGDPGYRFDISLNDFWPHVLR